MISMRRASAMLLVALFSVSLISPSVFASGGEKLPACCRRSGLHHCARMATESGSPSGPAVQEGRCSFFPALAGIPANRTVALAGVSQSAFQRRVIHKKSAFQAESLCQSSYSRAGQKRGPPTLLS
jgi:hypothetical protein